MQHPPPREQHTFRTAPLGLVVTHACAGLLKAPDETACDRVMQHCAARLTARQQMCPHLLAHTRLCILPPLFYCEQTRVCLAIGSPQSVKVCTGGRDGAARTSSTT
eukprot:6210841-Pleurochrysis_carterae.AAC.3